MLKKYIPLLSLAVLICWIQVPVTFAVLGGARPPSTSLTLLQPLDSDATTSTIAYAPGGSVFINYFNTIWPWVATVAAGIAVLHGLIGGFMILISGGGEAKQKGIERITAAAVGILMIGFFGFILRFLNNIYFQ